MTDELKPCPFCGGEAGMDGHTWSLKTGEDEAWVTCTKCGAYGPTSEDAIAAWNKRTGEKQ